MASKDRRKMMNKGEGNSLDFGERMYDPRIGRWFKIDPQASQMPQVSPYSFALNNPVYLTDEDGEIPIIPLLLKATAAAAADMLLQASMIYLTDATVKDFGSAFKKIDKSDVAWSFVEGLNPFKVPSGKAGQAAAVATADLLIYVGEQTLEGNEVSASEAGGEFIRGFLSELSGDQAGKLLSNKKVREKVGALIGEKELDKLTDKFYWYVGETEKGIIDKTGEIPNTGTNGKSKDIFFTNKEYKKASKAKSKNQLPNKPTYKVEIDPNNVEGKTYFSKVKSSHNRKWGKGGGTEATTSNPIKVDPSKITKLE